jgi:hypothetical protein
MSGNHEREGTRPAGDDAAVARAWRQASDEQPPARLDAVILAAAHRSVQEDEAGAKAIPASAPARSRWLRWQPLAAAATVAGLAFVLVQTLPRDRTLAPAIRIEAPAGAPEPAAAREKPGSAPAAATKAAPTAPVARSDPRMGVIAGASSDARSAEAVAPAEAQAPTALTAPDAADWVARIEALHASGDLAGAAAALREFRAIDREADASLPESLSDWARTVR